MNRSALFARCNTSLFDLLKYIYEKSNFFRIFFDYRKAKYIEIATYLYLNGNNLK